MISKSPLKCLRESLKNYKYIITDGCSFVKGIGCEICDLPFRSMGKNSRIQKCPHRFSSILSKKLEAKEVMFGSGGKSNIDILNHLYKNLKDYKDKSEECLVIVGTTHWMRGEYMSVDASPLHFDKGLYDDVIDDIPMIGKVRFKDLLLKRLKKEAIMESFERQYNLTLHWLESLGFDYVVFNSFHDWEFEKNQLMWNLETHHHKEFKNIKSWKLWINMYDDVNKPKNTLTASDGHPSIHAHKQMAEQIYDFIRRD